MIKPIKRTMISSFIYLYATAVAISTALELYNPAAKPFTEWPWRHDHCGFVSFRYTKCNVDPSFLIWKARQQIWSENGIAFGIHKLVMIVKLAILFSINLNNILQMVVFFFIKKKRTGQSKIRFFIGKKLFISFINICYLKHTFFD